MNRQNIAVIICHKVSFGQSIFVVISWLYIDVRAVPPSAFPDFGPIMPNIHLVCGNQLWRRA